MYLFNNVFSNALFCMHSGILFTRSVQDLQVRFQPSSSVDHDLGGSISSASQDDIGRFI